MSGSHKAAVSLVITVFLFAGFAVLSYTGLFDLVESRFYNPSVTRALTKETQGDSVTLQDFFIELQARFIASLDEPAVRRSFLPNQSAQDIYERSRLYGLLLESQAGLQSVRFIDAGGSRIHYSTYSPDILRQDMVSTAYRNYSTSTGDLPYDAVSVLNQGNPKITPDPANQRLIFSFPYYDSYDVYRGTALFSLSIRAVSEHLIIKSRIKIGEDVSIISPPSGIITGLPGSNADPIIPLILRTWNQGTLALTPLNLLNSSITFNLISAQTSQGIYIGRLVNETMFLFPPVMKLILLASFFFTSYLTIFLLFNLRQDPITIVQARMKNLEAALIEDYQSRKDTVDWIRWSQELAQRREDVREELKRNIKPKKGKKLDLQIDAIIDTFWGELVAVIKSHVETPVEQLDDARLQAIVNQVLIASRGQLGQLPALSAPGASLVAPVEIEELEYVEAEDLDELEEVDEVEELDSVDEAEPVLYEPVAAEETAKPALYEPVAAEETAEPALYEPVAAEETAEPALYEPGAVEETFEPALYVPGVASEDDALELELYEPLGDSLELDELGSEKDSKEPSDLTDEMPAEVAIEIPPPPEPSANLEEIDYYIEPVVDRAETKEPEWHETPAKAPESIVELEEMLEAEEDSKELLDETTELVEEPELIELETAELVEEPELIELETAELEEEPVAVDRAAEPELIELETADLEEEPEIEDLETAELVDFDLAEVAALNRDVDSVELELIEAAEEMVDELEELEATIDSDYKGEITVTDTMDQDQSPPEMEFIEEAAEALEEIEELEELEEIEEVLDLSMEDEEAPPAAPGRPPNRLDELASQIEFSPTPELDSPEELPITELEIVSPFATILSKLDVEVEAYDEDEFEPEDEEGSYTEPSASSAHNEEDDPPLTEDPEAQESDDESKKKNNRGLLNKINDARMNETDQQHTNPRNSAQIIESIDGLPIINEDTLLPDKKTEESLNPDFKALVDSVLTQK